MNAWTKLTLAIALAVAVAALGTPGAARGATTYIWNGSQSNDWTTAGNWTPNTGFPVTTDTATFNNTAAAVNNNTTINISAVNAATITFTSANAAAYTLGTSAGAGTITLDESGTIQVANTVTNSQLINSNVTLGTAVNGNPTFRNDSSTAPLIFAGNITGGTGGTAQTKTLTFNATSVTPVGIINGSITKGGLGTLSMQVAGGTWKLNNSATYNGNMSVNNTACALIVNGTLAGTSAVSVNTGAKFGGTGSVTAPVTIQDTSILAPGDFALAAAAQTGTLSITGNLTFATGTGKTNSLQAQIGGNTPGDGQGFYDQVNVAGTGTISVGSLSTLNISLVNGYTPQGTDQYFLLTKAAAGAFGTTFSNLPEGADVTALGTGFKITYLANWTGDPATSTLTGGNDVAVYSTNVPEPALAGLLALAAPALLASRGRRR